MADILTFSKWKEIHNGLLSAIDGPDGEKYLQMLERFLLRKPCWATEDMKAMFLQEAVRILGKDKVITFSQHKRMWPADLSEEPVIDYSLAEISLAAQRNKGGELWHLVYISGIAIRDMVAEFPDYFEINLPWLTNFGEPLSPGYYLINLRPVFENLPFDKQGREIGEKMGAAYFRTNHHAFVEAIVILGRTKGKSFEGLAAHWASYGKNLDSDTAFAIFKFGKFHLVEQKKAEGHEKIGVSLTMCRM